MQTMPSSPLLAGANTTEHVESTRVTSTAADVGTPPVTTDHQRVATEDTPIVKTTKETPKPSSSGVSKQTVKDAARSKAATSLFTDDDADADEDLFAPSAASKALALFIVCYFV